MVRTLHSHCQGPGVQSLVGGLRFHKSCGVCTPPPTKKEVPSIAPGIIVSIITINSIKYFSMSVSVFKLNIYNDSLELHCVQFIIPFYC